MSFWFFKRKEEDLAKKLNAYMQPIESSLKSSFSRIKQDMSVLSKSQKQIIEDSAYQKEINYQIIDRLEAIEQKLGIIESEPKENIHQITRIKQVQETQNSTKTPQQGQVPQGQYYQKFNADPWDSLTPVQRAILTKIGLLMTEGGQESIPIKYLAEELYPKKDYEDVRSMLSTYIDILIEFGLLTKKRKGRQTYVYLTDRGYSFQDTITKKKLKKPMKNHNENE